ncbi:MAG: helix-turn-helix domain-containing protein [Fischerella sp.]|jgi:cytoskeletal protein RodZ|uniref:helix-turn-helix domain-containing protein n=1 Tax=Fischerella sp. TaxID=1191 RepID=UPI00180A1B33|nr:RodZ domain-containing protein [Fischerella sp.]NWF60010.1 helix-turn-helix domain-containing protein [Fischerella sp.]
MTVTSFNEAQQEQLKEIGAYLRQIRQEKSVRIEQITAQTLIRQAFLEALEEGRYEDLPEPVFVQGFIRRYGDALGLDGTALAKNFAINFFLLDSGNAGNDSKNSKQNSNISNIHIPLVVPYVILLAVASFLLFFRLNPKNPADSVASNQKLKASSEKTVPTPIASLPETPAPTPAPIASSLEISPSTPETPAPTPTATASSPEALPSNLIASPVEVTIELQGESWVRVKADGKTAFEGTLNKGERKTWTANKQLTILSGNAGAVLISANNNERKPLGGLGSIKQVTFTPETVQSQ